jgi:hypothetical protein
VDGMDRLLDRFIDQWLRWEHQRKVRRGELRKSRIHRDQRFGVW